MLTAIFVTVLAGMNDDTHVDPKTLGLTWVAEKKEPSGFVVGGKNTTALLKGLKEINGRTVADLEKDMRPGATTEVGSENGFLGANESLLAVLAADNAYVVEELGLTHQQLARHLRFIVAAATKAGDESFTYHGRRFKASVLMSAGFQLSPFRDGTKTNGYVRLENVDTGKKLAYSPLVPDLAERYGFYEGKGTPYRLDPKDILAVLDFIKVEKK